MGKFDACNDQYELDHGHNQTVAEWIVNEPGVVHLRYANGAEYKAVLIKEKV